MSSPTITPLVALNHDKSREISVICRNRFPAFQISCDLQKPGGDWTGTGRNYSAMLIVRN